MRRLIARYFRSRGFEVVSSSEVEEAKALLDLRDFEAMITDLRLTELDRSEGLDLISHARYHRQDMRIVVLTGAPGEDVERACRRLGADEFLCKSQPLNDLLSAVVAERAQKNDETPSARPNRPTSASRDDLRCLSEKDLGVQ
ncbi:MAG: response regulator [Thermoanaerobaculia bacterium]|nr:response regulator [Thermoanaerobaculia bacterium]